MERSCILARLLLGVALGGATLCAGPVPGLAAAVPPRGATDARVRRVLYDGDQVYRLRGFVGYQIDLEFERGERFVGLGAGDIEGLAYASEANHLFLKPKALHVSTNLTVLTDRRQYLFDYTVSAHPPSIDDPDVVYALRFDYPPAPAEAAQSRELDRQLDRARAERPLNRDYWYCGSPLLQPIATTDDGVRTRLRFASNAELPAIFVRNEDDSESLVNFSVEADEIVVHRIARRFVLRRGRETGCVVNRGFAGSGVRLDSGTVAPDVERQTREVMP